MCDEEPAELVGISLNEASRRDIRLRGPASSETSSFRPRRSTVGKESRRRAKRSLSGRSSLTSSSTGATAPSSRFCSAKRCSISVSVELIHLGAPRNGDLPRDQGFFVGVSLEHHGVFTTTYISFAKIITSPCKPSQRSSVECHRNACAAGTQPKTFAGARKDVIIVAKET